MEVEEKSQHTISANGTHSLERAETNVIKVLSKTAEVTTELSRMEADFTGDAIGSYTKEIVELCREIKQDMKVPLSGLTENNQMTNNLSIYGPRKNLEIAHMRTHIIHAMLCQIKYNGELAQRIVKDKEEEMGELTKEEQ